MRGEFRRELGRSEAGWALATDPGVVAVGAAERARPPLPFSNWALNSAALALICVGRGGVGEMACGILNCGGKNWVGKGH